MRVELNREVKLACPLRRIETGVASVGVHTYIDILLGHQFKVKDTELGDIIELGKDISEIAKNEAGLELGSQEDGLVLEAIEHCLTNRYLGYCSVDRCLDYDAISLRLQRISGE